jgi:hypothetical protein
MVLWLHRIEDGDAVRVKIWIIRAMDLTITPGPGEPLPDVSLKYCMDASA